MMGGSLRGLFLAGVMAQQEIIPERWELNALARGARVKCGNKKFRFINEDEGLFFF